MEADVQKEISCQIIYSTAFSSANNQLTTGLIHLLSQQADNSWQLDSLHTEEIVQLNNRETVETNILQ